MELFPHTKDFIRARYFWLLERISPSKYADNFHLIPIIINNFNRLETLKLLISSLEERGYHNIYILDNKSTYHPLLEWYKTSPYEVIYLPGNLGFKALWKHKPTRKRFCKDYYIYTDADVMLDKSCPQDIIQRMHHLLKNVYPYAFKIGPMIRIDDLPDYYNHKADVIAWEKRYFDIFIKKDNLYRAPIDTTFALYRPRIGLSRRVTLEAYRMAMPYAIRHLPWYTDSANPSAEEVYYKNHCAQPTDWSKK